MKRFAALVPFALLLVACPGNIVLESRGHESFPTSDGGTSTAKRRLSVAADPSGRWVIDASASAELHKLVLVDMTTHSARAFDDLARIHAASFWKAERGHGIDVASRWIVGGRLIVRIASFDLDAGTFIFRRDLRFGADYYGGDGVIELVGTNEALFVRAGSQIVALDARTGGNLGAFDGANGNVEMTPVPAIGVAAFTTKGDVVVLRERDASPRCVASLDEVLMKPRWRGLVRAVVVGSRAFVNVFVTGVTKNESRIVVVDTELCESIGDFAGPGGGRMAAVEGGIATVVDRDELVPDTTLPEDVKTSATRYHLRIVDAVTLESSFVALSDRFVDWIASADGKKVVTLDGDVVRVVDVATRTASAPIALQALRVLAGSPDGRWTYVVTATGSIAVVDVSANTANVIRTDDGWSWDAAVAPVGLDGIVLSGTPPSSSCHKGSSLQILDRATGTLTCLNPPPM